MLQGIAFGNETLWQPMLALDSALYVRGAATKFLKARKKTSDAVTTTMKKEGGFVPYAAQMKNLTKLYANPSKWIVKELPLRLQCGPSPGGRNGKCVGTTMKYVVRALEHMIQHFFCLVVAHADDTGQLMSFFCFAHSHVDSCIHMDSVGLLWVHCLIVSIEYFRVSPRHV